MLSNWKHHAILCAVRAAQRRQLTITVALTGAWDSTRSDQLIHNRNHQPILCHSRFIHLCASLIATGSDPPQLTLANVEHVNRSVWMCDEQIAGAREQPNAKLWGQEPAPLLKQRWPVESGLVDEVVMDVHYGRIGLITE